MKALKVDAAASSAMTGQQAGNKIEGTGTSSATYYMGSDGRLVAANVQLELHAGHHHAAAARSDPPDIKGSLTITMLK